MTEKALLIRGVDTLLFRDGRPFSDDPGSRADSLLVPFPSTLAGYLRTTKGRRAGRVDWESISAEVRVRGPLLTSNGIPLLRAPADAVVIEKDSDEKGDSGKRGVTDEGRSCVDSKDKVLKMMRLLPERPREGEGTNMVSGMLPLPPTEEEKPASGFDYWTWEHVMAWLREQEIDPAALPTNLAPWTDERVHLKVDAETKAASEGALFTTRMVAFDRHRPKDSDGGCAEHREYALLCKVSGVEPPEHVLGPGPLGGECRTAVVEAAADAEWPECPPDLREALSKCTGVRMMLATPAIFERGWIPQWLDKTTKEGSPPCAPDLRLKLVSAAVPRHVAVSGWDHTRNYPKPVRWAAPAGSVYFFEVVNGEAAALAGEAWLQPVSDDDKDRSDGFGLALWGTWNRREEKE